MKPLQGQETPPPAHRDTTAAAVDSAAVTGDPAAVAGDTAGGAAIDSARAVPESAVVTSAANLAVPAGGAQDSLQPPVTPMGAFVRSLLIPGWGQAAVDQPGRGAFYFAAGSFTVFMVIKSQAELNAAENTIPTDQQLIDDKKGKRETWIVLWLFAALFSGVDAWVSAHLYDFEGEITPPDDGSLGVQFQYSVPVGGP